MQDSWFPLLRPAMQIRRTARVLQPPNPSHPPTRLTPPLTPSENTTVEHVSLNAISWSRKNTLRGLVGSEGVWDNVRFIFAYSLLTNEPSSGLGISGSALFSVASIAAQAPNTQINSAGGFSTCSLPCARQVPDFSSWRRGIRRNPDLL